MVLDFIGRQSLGLSSQFKAAPPISVLHNPPLTRLIARQANHKKLSGGVFSHGYFPIVRSMFRCHVPVNQAFHE